VVQEVRVKNETAVLDTDKVYSGMENPDKEEGPARKALGLPVKKQLIFYKDKRDAGSAVKVTKYRILKMHVAEENWYTVEVTLEDGTGISIHSAYLAEMQRPGFVEDMAAQMA
jgi:hypothetical protein